MREIMQSSRDYVSRTASGGHKRFEQLKNLQFENLNDIYIILMPVFAACK